MKRYALIAALILLTGCAATPEETSSSTGDIFVDIANNDKSVEPILAVGSELENGFSITADYGEYGHIDYDLHYSESGEYTETLAFCYPAIDNLNDFITGTGLRVSTMDMTDIGNGAYFCWLETNTIPHFNSHLTKDKQLEVYRGL